jgi:hypothetical protein
MTQEQYRTLRPGDFVHTADGATYPVIGKTPRGSLILGTLIMEQDMAAYEVGPARPVVPGTREA